jgi:dTDP-4-amino-4,6-dideoxy-D-galactose acyltransferase
MTPIEDGKSMSTSGKTGYYSPFSFLIETDLCAKEFLRDLERDVVNGSVSRFNDINGNCIYYRNLNWDTDFFGIPTFRIEYTELYPNIQYLAAQSAFKEFREHLSSLCSEFYLFAEVPSEDSAVIAGMSGAGWRLIETRITCFRDDLQEFNYNTEFATRSATATDIPELRLAAVQAVNAYDRFHADDFFTPNEADDFMAIFIENSVRGFADEVIVPTTGLANAFLTGNYLATPLSLAGRKIVKMVFSAATTARR